MKQKISWFSSLLDLDRLNIANCRCGDTKLCSYLSWTDGLDIYHKMATLLGLELEIIRK
ncbi:hypothetical protein [Orenia metallireducens]|uniref:hypothetical protein n=1 Tax=Orenia metallireducens TaxID=1413210 RepID=UPI00159F1399|nr:hypothetical protein [Orenia metallireducens]